MREPNSRQRSWGDHPIVVLVGVAAALITIATGCLALYSYYERMPSQQVTRVVPVAPVESVTVSVTALSPMTHEAASPSAEVPDIEPPQNTDSRKSYLPPTAVGVWEGEWSNETGILYDCIMHIDVSASNNLSGSIIWTLRQSPRSSDQPKVGLQGTEYIRGIYDPITHSVKAEGYDEEDPNEVIGLDKYKLVLSEDGARLSGETESHGTWLGRLSATRMQ